MLPDLQLTPTDLQQFDYPISFPSPPESLTLHTETHPHLPDGGLDRHDEELSWYFFLAEISLRRTINDVLLLFYSMSEEQWIDNIDLICRQFDESIKQISLW